MNKICKKFDMFYTALTLNLSDKKFKWIINSLLFYIVLCTWINKSLFKADDVLTTAIHAIGYFCLFVLAIVLNSGNAQRRPYISKIFLFLYISFSVTFIIGAVFTVRMSSILLGGTYIVSMILIVLFCQEEERKKALINGLFNSIILNYFIIIVISLFTINAKEQIQYAGLFDNPNSLGVFCIAAFIAFLYECVYKEKYIYFIGLGTCLSVAFATQSRTVLLCFIVNAVIICIYALIRRKVINFKYIFAVIIGAVITFLLIFYISPFFDDIKNTVLQPEYTIDEKGQGVEGQGETDLDNTADVPSESEKIEIPLEDRDFNRVTHGITDGGDVLSGRMGIWKTYLSDINLAPHNDSQLPQVDGETISFSAHNTYIHLAYCFGVLCGILYLFTNITAGITSLKRVWENKNEFYYIIAMMAVLNYGMLTVVETSYDILSNVVCLMYWFITLIVVMPNAKRRRDIN